MKKKNLSLKKLMEGIDWDDTPKVNRFEVTEGETNFDVIKDDVKELNNFKNNVTKALWIIYTAVSGLIIKLIWGD